MRTFIRKARDALIGRPNGSHALDDALAVREATARDRQHASAHVRRTMREHAGMFSFPVEDIGRAFRDGDRER